ncbi:MAG: ferritin-like domain-containing protein [Gemmataceae bacterium]
MAIDSGVYARSTRQALPRPVKATKPPGLSRPRSTADWIAYFQGNASRNRAVPWTRGEMRPETTAIARSLQAWQLGETSEGRHLLAVATRYAARNGDLEFPALIGLFIREEQRHGELLGQFLDLAGIGRIQADWGDSLFRAVRYCLTNMEIWTTPVVMVETLATIYYNAIRRATGSRVLQTICCQILADEIPHVQFQCERLAQILRHRSRFGFQLTLLAQRLLFLVIVVLVWSGHRCALRAGGYSWRHYWRASWSKMNCSWRKMDPQRYAWRTEIDSVVTAFQATGWSASGPRS